MRPRSITSSTTASPPPQGETPPPAADLTSTNRLTELTSDSSEPETSTEAIVLSRSQQRACLKLIAAGASPIAVCLKLGVLIESFDLTCEREPLFRQRLERIDRALDENVDAAIYREALKGSTAAQANWKRNRTETRQPEPAEVTGDDLDQMTTQQLLDWQARLMKLGSSPDIETDPS